MSFASRRAGALPLPPAETHYTRSDLVNCLRASYGVALARALTSSDMRSMDDRKEVARRFGALVTQLARRKGIDVSSGAGGRAELARKLDMHPSMVGRALDGQVLPQPWQFTVWAHVLEVPLRNLMVESGVISPEDWPEDGVPVVPSVTSPPQPPTAEAVVDSLKIRNPIIRRGLIANIENALAMQAEEDGRGGVNGGAVARG